MARSIAFYSSIFLLLLICNSFANAEDFEITIQITDHKFSPEIIEVPADKKIVLRVVNNDSTLEEFESLDLKREKMIPGNSSVRIVLAPLAPGEYKFFGEFHEETAHGKIIAVPNKNE